MKLRSHYLPTPPAIGVSIPHVGDATLLKSLPDAHWEVWLIDNGSDDPLASPTDLSWRSDGRHIREEELGLTPARLREIAEAKGDLLIFVDDDNMLRCDYLEVAARISLTHPYLGAFGGLEYVAADALIAGRSAE